MAAAMSATVVFATAGTVAVISTPSTVRMICSAPAVKSATSKSVPSGYSSGSPTKWAMTPAAPPEMVSRSVPAAGRTVSPLMVIATRSDSAGMKA